MVQWLRLHAPNAGGLGSIPGQGTRSHMPQVRVRMPQLRVCMPQLKIPHATTKDPACRNGGPTLAMKIPRAATKTRHSQINK